MLDMSFTKSDQLYCCEFTTPKRYADMSAFSAEYWAYKT